MWPATPSSDFWIRLSVVTKGFEEKNDKDSFINGGSASVDCTAIDRIAQKKTEWNSFLMNNVSILMNYYTRELFLLELNVW